MIYLLFFLGSLNASEPPIPPIIRPREVIIYPPTTPAEFLERRRILTEALADPNGVRLIVKDKK